MTTPPTTFTPTAVALLARADYVCNELDYRCIEVGVVRDALPLIEQEARAEAEAEMARLRALAASWIAYLHGYIRGASGWHTAEDWRGCPLHPCAEARAALAPAATPAPLAPHTHPRSTADLLNTVIGPSEAQKAKAAKRSAELAAERIARQAKELFGGQPPPAPGERCAYRSNGIACPFSKAHPVHAHRGGHLTHFFQPETAP